MSVPLASLSCSPASGVRAVRPATLALAAAFALSVLPTALVEIPAMVDYPNHLARMSILARAGSGHEHPFYEVHWAFYPNLAMDLAVPVLARLVGVVAATKLFLLATQLLVVSGAMALSWAHRREAVGAGLVACLFLHAIPFAFGFLNFGFGLGLALWGMAAWLRLAEAPLALRLLVHAAFVAALAVSHLFALGLYGFTIGVVELWRAYRARVPLGRTALLFAGMAAPVLPLAILFGGGGGAVGGTGTVWSWHAKLFWLGLLNGYGRPWALALTLPLLVALYVAVRRGWLRPLGAGVALGPAFALLYGLMPFRLFDTGFVDGRVLLAAVLVMPAFVTLQLPDRATKRGAAVLLGAALLANGGVVAATQWDYRREYRDLLAAFDAMPAGARLLVADAGEAADPPADLRDYPMYHAGTLAVLSRDAFVASLFTYPGKQPVLPRPAVRDMALVEGGPIPLAFLEAYAAGGAVPPENAFVRNWTRRFDHLLLLHPPTGDPLPGLLHRVAGARRFTLYRIEAAPLASTRP